MTATPSPLAPELLAVLVDPVDRRPLVPDGDRLVNPSRAVAYPVVDGIPVLLPQAAVVLTDPPAPGSHASGAHAGAG